MTIAVHRSVISSAKTWVLALGSSRVCGRPAGGGAIAMTLGDGLGLGLGDAVGDGFAGAGERGGVAPACDCAVAHPAATSTVRTSPSAREASDQQPGVDRAPAVRAS